MTDINSNRVVRCHLYSKINSEGLRCPFDNPEHKDNDSLTAFWRALIRETSKIEAQYTHIFDGTAIMDSLHVTPNNASLTFHRTVREIFHSGQDAAGIHQASVLCNFGRICSLLAFSGVFAVHCVRNEMPQLVDQVVHWTVDYIDANLLVWINQHGGWMKLFTPAAIPKEEPWLSYRVMLGVVALGTVTLLAVRRARSNGLF